jgi:hypothetical protein
MTASKRKAGRPKGSTKPKAAYMAAKKQSALKSCAPIEMSLPPISTLDRHGVDPLLVTLREVHGETGRADIAPELQAAARATTARVKEAVQIELREHDVIAAA